MTDNKVKEIITKLKVQIFDIRRHGDSQDAVSWANEDGVILSANDAEELIRMLKEKEE